MLATAAKHYRYVYRSDIKSYYASIDHDILLKQLKQWVRDPEVLRLVKESYDRLVWVDGDYQCVKQGLAKGCSLSPLLGAVYLHALDQACEREGLFYSRYMDDWVILSKKRWPLKRAIKRMHQVLRDLKLTIRPEKTIIGKVEKGFDFCGYWYTPEGVSISAKSKQRCIARTARLIEQQASVARVEQYWKQWQRWAGEVNVPLSSGFKTDEDKAICLWFWIWLGLRWEPVLAH